MTMEHINGKAMEKPEHATMREAQRECRRLRAFSDHAAHKRAAEIEAQWRNHPDYESDLACIMRAQAAPRTGQ